MFVVSAVEEVGDGVVVVVDVVVVEEGAKRVLLKYGRRQHDS